MKLRAILPLIIGLAVGGLAIKLGRDVLRNAQGAGSSVDTVGVVVARKPIPVATEITEAMLGVQQTSKDLAPRQLFSEVEEVIGRVTKVEVPAGLPVTGLLLAPAGTKAGLPSRIPKGYRAVAVKVDEYSSVGGFLTPGCRVDVAAVMTVKLATGQNETVSKVILQDIEVSAVGQNLGDSVGDPSAGLSKSVTLLLRPEEVPALHLAASRGKICLAMRNAVENQRTPELVGTTEKKILGQPDQPAAAPASKKPGLLGWLLNRPKEPAPKPAPREPVRPVAPTPAPPPKAPPPYVVEVVRAGKVQTVAFSGPDSVQRVGDGPVGRSAPIRPSLAACGLQPPRPVRSPVETGDAAPMKEQASPETPDESDRPG